MRNPSNASKHESQIYSGFWTFPILRFSQCSSQDWPLLYTFAKILPSALWSKHDSAIPRKSLQVTLMQEKTCSNWLKNIRVCTRAVMKAYLPYTSQHYPRKHSCTTWLHPRTISTLHSWSLQLQESKIKETLLNQRGNEKLNESRAPSETRPLLCSNYSGNNLLAASALCKQLLCCNAVQLLWWAGFSRPQRQQSVKLIFFFTNQDKKKREKETEKRTQK